MEHSLPLDFSLWVQELHELRSGDPQLSSKGYDMGSKALSLEMKKEIDKDVVMAGLRTLPRKNGRFREGRGKIRQF